MTLLIGSTLAFWIASHPVSAQLRIYTIGLVVVDQVDSLALPPHLQSQHPQVAVELRQNLHTLFAELERFRIRDLEDPVGSSSPEVDFVARVTLKKADKVFRNQVRYFRSGEDPLLSVAGGSEVSTPYEIVSMPAIAGGVEVQLKDPQQDKIIWSALRDSTVVVPFDPREFIYNPWKYPGITPPSLIRAYLADIMRLQQTNRTVERLLNVADRWFVSEPQRDLEITRALLAGLVASLGPDLDSNLPLEGRIAALLPERDGQPHVLVDIGAHHGLAPRLRLEVWRSSPTGEKVGQIEVVSVDSSTAVARLCKLEKKLRRRGEGLEPSDRIVSRRRVSRF